MLRNLCAALESSRKTLTSLSPAPSRWWAPCSSASPYSSSFSSLNQSDDPALATPPKLMVVQPRLRPEKLLQAKLNEALCLANSLEEQRDGYFHTDFFDKPLPPHLLVQNPSLKGHKPRAGSQKNLSFSLSAPPPPNFLYFMLCECALCFFQTPILGLEPLTPSNAI